PYDDVMTTSYFENVRSSCAIKKGVSLIEINRANPLSITPKFRVSRNMGLPVAGRSRGRLGCEIASNCDLSVPKTPAIGFAIAGESEHDCWTFAIAFLFVRMV